MKYKVISTDFDGTLLSSTKKLSEENKNALQKCREHGCIVIGITARNLSSIKAVCDINIFDYLIINNGTYIYNVREGKGKYVGIISNNTVQAITDEFIEKSVGIDYCSVDMYYSNKTKLLVERPFHLQVTSFSEVEEPVSRINIFGKSNEDVFKMNEEINHKYENLHTITMLDTDNGSDRRWVAINPKNCNKASALKLLVSELNIDLNAVIFFGDATNDVELITQAGLGIAMNNAISEVKDMADDITLTNDENGVAYYLRKILK